MEQLRAYTDQLFLNNGLKFGTLNNQILFTLAGFSNQTNEVLARLCLAIPRNTFVSKLYITKVNYDLSKQRKQKKIKWVAKTIVIFVQIELYIIPDCTCFAVDTFLKYTQISCKEKWQHMCRFITSCKVQRKREVMKQVQEKNRIGWVHQVL